jgi:hypothetical protein
MKVAVNLATQFQRIRWLANKNPFGWKLSWPEIKVGIGLEEIRELRNI